MRIAGSVCNYPFSMSFDKGESDGLGRLVKDIAFWDDEKLQSIRSDSDASKGSSEEVANSLVVSLNQIDTYRSDGVKIIILGQTKDYGGGGVIESLVSELKNVGPVSFFYHIVNCCLHAQSKALHQSV